MEARQDMNQRLHNLLDRGCWHEGSGAQSAPKPSMRCVKCGEPEPLNSPDYCSDLNLCAEAEKVVIEKVGAVQYSNFIADQREPHPTNKYEFAECILLASASTRVAAMLAALEALTTEGE